MTTMTTTRTLGRSGIEVSALGVGCSAIGGPFWEDGEPLRGARSTTSLSAHCTGR